MQGDECNDLARPDDHGAESGCALVILGRELYYLLWVTAKLPSENSQLADPCVLWFLRHRVP